jgi:hypothetical protein
MELGLYKDWNFDFRRGKLKIEGFEMWQGEVTEPMDKTDVRKYLAIGLLRSRIIRHS